MRITAFDADGFQVGTDQVNASVQFDVLEVSAGCNAIARLELLSHAVNDDAWDHLVFHRTTSDFDGDGDVGTDADIEAFFACLAGNCCPTCGSADFNGDGDLGTDADIEAFFRVLAGGNC